MSRCVLFFLLLLVSAPVPADSPRLPAAAIASSHPLATEAGHAILAEGGNAFDAALAVAAVLGVVDPANTGLGGGGFWLLHRAADGFEIVVDGRERAPAAAGADMYLDRAGQIMARSSLDGALAAAIPGTPAAMAHISEKYGRLPLATVLAPAVRLAHEGFTISERYQKMIERRLPALADSPAAAAIFLPDGLAPEPGYRVRQPELAATLKRLASDGGKSFYHGDIARRLVEGVRAGGGIWTLADLAGYRPVERAPLRAEYRGMRITTVPPPSAGGVALIQMLKILEPYRLDKPARRDRERLLIEAMRQAYRDRAEHLGDPDFANVDVARLLSAEHIARQRAQLGAHGTKPAADTAPRAEGANTTHFSVIDRAGNRVAATLTLNTHFGSGFMPPDTGVLLNNEMDDFVIRPGAANTYGLVGSQANAIAPGKRPLSSMTPSFLETPDKVVALGTPGGSRIISMLLLASLEVAAGRGDLRAWLKRPRFHHQYLPDQVEYEPAAFDELTARRLGKLGYTLKRLDSEYGNMQAVVWHKTDNRLEAASDPRGDGAAWVK
ncbi:MAG: gamma-glutamyltransferase [Gammaproteobacteria bacterium]|nr:gamma-glutamyltransferase [Gammaproteobacteria bacterium]